MWYLQRGSSRAIGPLSAEEILDGLKSGDIPRDTKVCAVDGKQWLPLDAVPQFAPTLQDKPPRLPPDESLVKAAERPRPRIVRPLDRMPTNARARAATAVSGSVLAASAVSMLIVFAPTPALATLLDSVRALRSALVVSGALGVVAWGAACLATRLLERGRRDARALARASLLPLAASILALAVGLVTVGRGLAPKADVWQARTVLGALLAASVAGTFAWSALLGRSLRDAVDRRRDGLAAFVLAMLAVVFAPTARALAAATDVVRVDGPLFADETTLRKFVDALRAGASGTGALDESLKQAVFVPPGTRVRYLDELVVETDAGAFVARKVLLLDGPDRGRALFVRCR